MLIVANVAAADVTPGPAPIPMNIGRPYLHLETAAPPDGKRFVVYPFQRSSSDDYVVLELGRTNDIPLRPQRARADVYLVDASYQGDGSDLRDEHIGTHIGHLRAEAPPPGLGEVHFGEPGAAIVAAGDGYRVQQDSHATLNLGMVVMLLGGGIYLWWRKKNGGGRSAQRP